MNGFPERISAWTRRTWWVLVVVMGANNAATADASLPSSIDIFTTAEFPITRTAFIDASPRARFTTLTVYRVDGLQALAQHLSVDLPKDPARAQAMALERMQSDGARIRRLAQDGAEALARAMRYRIDRYPAMVFNDGESVIYGITNVEEAVAMYAAARRRR